MTVVPLSYQSSRNDPVNVAREMRPLLTSVVSRYRGTVVEAYVQDMEPGQ